MKVMLMHGEASFIQSVRVLSDLLEDLVGLFRIEAERMIHKSVSTTASLQQAGLLLCFAFIVVSFCGCPGTQTELCQGTVEVASETLLTVGGNGSAWDILTANEGGFVIAGQAYSGETSRTNAFIAKVNMYGTVNWITSSADSEDSGFFSLKPSGGGGYLLAGTSGGTLGYGRNFFGNPDILIAEVDEEGELVWKRTIEVNGFSVAYGICVNLDGSFVIAGLTEGQGQNFTDALIMKFSAEGSENWRLQMSLSQGLSAALDVTTTLDGGFVFAGEAIQSQGLYIVKLNSSGEMQWTYTASDSGLLLGRGERIIQTQNGEYVVVGQRIDTFFVARLNTNGAVLWSTEVPGSPYAEGFDVVELGDGDLVASGRSFSRASSTQPRSCTRYFAARLSSDGDIRWSGQYGEEGQTGTAYALTLGSEERIVLVGADLSRGFYMIVADVGETVYGYHR